MDQIRIPDEVTEATTPVPAGPIALERVDADAVKVLQRLTKQGFEAYLVGGCVRDLLLGLQPKDFDIATDARPRQIKRLFRNSRIIGRRFKLVHVTFGAKNIEVSTFRGPPGAGSEDVSPEDEGIEGGEVEAAEAEEEDLLIRRDNAFGTLEEDAQRRDFTVNALFYDVVGQRVIDSVGGQLDLDRRVIRTIGDPRRRVREDPVRVLRAVKFATRLRFSIDAELFASMREYHADIARAAPPRVVEEVLRILGGGAAAEAMALLHEIRVLPVLFPELDELLDDPEHRRLFLRALEALDHLDRGQRAFSNAVFLGTLFALPVMMQLEQAEQSKSRRDPGLLVDEFLLPFARHTRLARRDLSRMKSMYLAQRRFLQTKTRRRHGTRVSDLVRRDYFEDAFTLFRILSLARGEGERVAQWEARLKDLPRPIAARDPTRRKRRRRRRPGAPAEASPSELSPPELSSEALDAAAENWETRATGAAGEPGPPPM